MEVTERSILKGPKLVIDQQELDQIIKANPTASLTMDDVQQKRLFAFEARVIDSTPTMNKRLYTKEWQAKVLPQWGNGVRLVWGENSHNPDDRSDFGWTYSGKLTGNGVTSTIVKVAIPVIPEDTTPLVERLRLGLSKGLSLSAEISKESTKTRPDGITEISGEGDSRILHLAVTTSPASAGATVLATSESIRVDEQRPPRNEQAEAALKAESDRLLAELKSIKKPVILQAVKFSKLNRPDKNVDQLQESLETMPLDEIREYADVQEAIYKAKNPKANQQLAQASEQDSRVASGVPMEPKTLNEIMKALR